MNMMISKAKAIEIISEHQEIYKELAEINWYYQGKVDMCIELQKIFEEVNEHEAIVGKDTTAENMDDTEQ